MSIGASYSRILLFHPKYSVAVLGSAHWQLSAVQKKGFAVVNQEAHLEHETVDLSHC